MNYTAHPLRFTTKPFHPPTLHSYPANNATEVTAFCAGERAAVAAAHAFLYANGGVDPQACVHYETASIPLRADSPAACAAKVRAAIALVDTARSVGFASDRTGGKDYTDDNVAAAIATFMIARKEQWYFGVLQTTNNFTASTAALLLRDDGAPLGDATADGNVFSRRYDKATVSFDCNTFTATFTPV